MSVHQPQHETTTKGIVSCGGKERRRRRIRRVALCLPLLLAIPFLALHSSGTTAAPWWERQLSHHSGSTHHRRLHLSDRALGHDWRTLDGTRPKLKGNMQLQLITLSPATVVEPDTTKATPNASEAHRTLCALVIDSSCQAYWQQPNNLPLSPYPQGSKECPNGCNRVGSCNYDLGECQCPVGFGGHDCTEVVKRPCSHRERSPNDPDGVPIGSAPMTTPGWTASRCAGECDEMIGLCFCGHGSKFARVPAPKGSPWGTPPVKAGIPMVVPCQPRNDENGRHVSFGSIDWKDLYGPNGWCNAPATARNCPCSLENLHGVDCSIVSEAWCPNQCNLRGQCHLGFCKCNEGWYGTACDRLKSGAIYTEPSTSEAHRMQQVWREPLHTKPPANATNTHRRRPLIFVYDLPAEFNTRLVQMKNNPSVCNWRRFRSNNMTELQPGVYQVETYLHEMLLQSPHRTLDPDEADYFYVPLYYASCYAWPILGWSDGPWWHVPSNSNRPVQAAYMFLKAKRWLQQAYPYWNRSQGHDHIFTTVHDEGACYMPSEVYDTAIFLTHWGRTDRHHDSGSAYVPDNYSSAIQDQWQAKYTEDWRVLWRGHACYTAGKDLIIPSFKAPSHFASSSLLGSKPLKRDIFAYFKGDVGLHRQWFYSRGIRQTLVKLAHEDDWWGKYSIIIGDRTQISDQYSTSLARSKFCFVLPGDGWSGRAEDAVLHGCIPVIIQDGVEPPLHSMLDWEQFSIRIPQANMTQVPQILASISEERVAEMQRALHKVWHRFVYATGPWHRRELRDWYGPHQREVKTWATHPLAPLSRFPFANDAFNTIMQWLYGRMKPVHAHRMIDAVVTAQHDPQHQPHVEERE